jgi:hypothetical protein
MNTKLRIHVRQRQQYLWFVALLLAPIITQAAQVTCADQCQLGSATAGAVCELFDHQQQTWSATLTDGSGQLHHRARNYLPWLRRWMMPAGGVMSVYFTDDSFTQVASYGGERDVAIWTGTYLAIEALRFMATGSEDAQQAMHTTAQTLHHWWTISGDRGNLARYAAPSSSSAAILAALPADDSEVHVNWLYDGVLWNWRGATSRDQYQGVLLGYALAYEASAADSALRELLRTDIVAFAEQLMHTEQRDITLLVNDQSFTASVDLSQVIYSTADQADTGLTVAIDLTTGEVTGNGLLVFWPNPARYLRQLPGLFWLPEIVLPTQALQVGAAFALALHVTQDQPLYTNRREALAAYYDQHRSEWLDIATQWQNRNDCGDSYHGLNIGVLPLYLWTRYAPTDADKTQLRQQVLIDRLWPAVADHKNVWFAFVYAALASTQADLEAVIASHVEQLAGFPAAPNRARAIDVQADYPASTECDGLAATAVDVNQRIPATFIWERQPWGMVDPGHPTHVYGGIDYLLAYWFGRYAGFIADDAPETCLAWRDAPLPTTPQPPGRLEIPQPQSYQSGIGLVSGWFCAADTITIQIDGQRLLPTAYKTERADTESLCGDQDNGFAFLINYNALGDGLHRIVAYADDQPFASANFITRTLGTEFYDGLQASVAVTDFPTAGQTTMLHWQPAKQNFIIGDAPAGDQMPAMQPPSEQGLLEIPQPTSIQSGIGVVSGWFCDATTLQIQFDQGRLLSAAYGTERRDTISRCGDSDNGFGFLVNYNALGAGTHQLTVYADGQPFANTYFEVQTLGQEFIRGLNHQVTIVDFPRPGIAAHLQWQEANQNFVLTNLTTTP